MCSSPQGKNRKLKYEWLCDWLPWEKLIVNIKGHLTSLKLRPHHPLVKHFYTAQQEKRKKQ